MRVSLLLIHIFTTQNSQNDDKKEGEGEKKETRRKDKQEKFGQCQSDSEEPCVCDKLGTQLCKGRGRGLTQQRSPDVYFRSLIDVTWPYCRFYDGPSILDSMGKSKRW